MAGGGEVEKQEASNLWHSWKIDALEGCTASATEQKLLQSLEANLKSHFAVMENTVIHHAEQEDLREQISESMSAILSTRAIAMRRLVGLPMQMTFLLTSYEQGWPGGVL